LWTCCAVVREVAVTAEVIKLDGLPETAGNGGKRDRTILYNGGGFKKAGKRAQGWVLISVCFGLRGHCVEWMEESSVRESERKRDI